MLQDIASVVGYIMEGGYGGFAEYEDQKERQRAYNASQLAYEEREYLRLLERNKFIKTKRIGEKLMVRLTKKGNLQALRDKIRYTKQHCNRGICIVVFDVPESEKHVRNELRRILAECGFTMLQKSVWYTDKDVLSELCALLQGSNLDEWVRIIVGDEIHTTAIKRAIVRMKIRAASKRHRSLQ